MALTHINHSYNLYAAWKTNHVLYTIHHSVYIDVYIFFFKWSFHHTYMCAFIDTLANITFTFLLGLGPSSLKGGPAPRNGPETSDGPEPRSGLASSTAAGLRLTRLSNVLVLT